MILHVGSYVLEVKVKSDEKIILENTKLVMILDVGILFWKYVHKSKTLEKKSSFSSLFM